MTFPTHLLTLLLGHAGLANLVKGHVHLLEVSGMRI